MSRRNNRKIAYCLLVCLSLVFLLAGCGEAKEYRQSVSAMDTVIAVTAYGSKAESGIKAAESAILAIDAAVNPDNDTSTVYALNHANGNQVTISGQVADMLNSAKLVYDQTEGAYDLTVYPLLELWGFTNEKYYVPSADEDFQALSKLCMDKIQITSFPTSGTYSVILPDYGSLSFASCARGCASKYAIDALRKNGVVSGIVSCSGNVQTLGQKPDGSNWTVGIVDPSNTSGYLGTVSVGEIAISTSAPYQDYMPANPNYHHLFSTKTGYPTNNGILSLTVLCEDGTMADCLATAMYVSGKSAALNYWKTYGGFEMIIIDDSYNILCTSGLIEQFSLKNSNYTLSYYEG